MNQDQFYSTLRTLLKIIGSALATHGLTKAAGIVNTEDFIGLVLALAGVVWSHYNHASDTPTTPTSKTSVYAWLLIGALAIGLTPALTGCKSTPPQTIAYQAASTTTITVEAAIRAYDVFAAQGKTTIAQNAQVKAAYEKYQAAAAVVCDAGAIYAATSGTNAPAASLALQVAVQNSTASIADVVNLVQSFGVKLQ